MVKNIIFYIFCIINFVKSEIIFDISQNLNNVTIGEYYPCDDNICSNIFTITYQSKKCIFSLYDNKNNPMFVCNVDSWYGTSLKDADSNRLYQCLQTYYSPDINSYILERCYVGDGYDLESKIAMEFIGRHRIYEKFVRDVDISSEFLSKMNRLMILTEKINDINDLF